MTKKTQMEIRGNYRIVENGSEIEDMFQITEELEDVMSDCLVIARKGKRSGLKKIKRQIDKYPHCPQLKNYLTVWYSVTGNWERSHEANHWLVAEHPDYIFGKINLANEYLKKKEYDQVSSVLGAEMRIDSLYPDRKAFHIDEVTGFLSVAVRYFAGIADFDRAEVELAEMKEIAPFETITAEMGNYLIQRRLLHGMEFMHERMKNNIDVEVPPQSYDDTAFEAPTFNHPEVMVLYTNGLRIEKEILEKIISLPRETLIKDLEMMLQDSIDRFGYFSEMDEWDDATGMFLLHAFFILAEIRATESITSLLHILGQSEDFLDFYFADHLTETIWESFYRLASDDLDVLKEFACKPGVCATSKSVVAEVVEQVVHHHPNRRNEAIVWFRDVFNFFVESEIEDNVIDSSAIGFMISNCLNMEAVELLPEIERLFKLNYVSLIVVGTFEDVQRSFGEDRGFTRKRELMGMADRYHEVVSTWASYQEEEDDFDDEEFENDHKGDSGDFSVGGPVKEIENRSSYQSTTPVTVAAKTGRNEPCPCGSGKKYKKCCIKK